MSDIHEDLKRLRRVMKIIRRKGCDLTICLGDISGFSDRHYHHDRSRNASACLEIIRNSCKIIIPGNHDLHATGRIPELPDDAAYEYWEHEEDSDPGFSKEEIDFLSGLPEYAILPVRDYNILLSHYFEPNISGVKKGFFDSGKELTPHFKLMEEQNCKLGFTGHSHIHGFYSSTSEGFKYYGYRQLRLKDFPVVIGIPPVTRNHSSSGFCIFDTDSHLLKVKNLY